MTAPTLVSYTDIAWNSITTPRSTASVSWQSGDLIVVAGGNSSGDQALGLPAATGLTFASVFGGQVGTTASNCGANIWTATAGSAGSSAVTGSDGGATNHWGIAVWVWRASGGAGNHASNVSAETLSLTRSGANSAVVCGLFDWNATATTGYAWTPAATDDRQHSQDGSYYSYYVADWGDQGTAGSTSYGITGVTGGPFTNVLLEILGSGSGSAYTADASLAVTAALSARFTSPPLQPFVTRSHMPRLAETYRFIR